MFWENLGLFRRAISPLKWCKMVRMGDLAYTFIRIKFTNSISMRLQYWVHRHFPWRFIAVLTKNPIVFMVVYINDDPNSGGNIQKNEYLRRFRGSSRQENISGFYLIGARWARYIMIMQLKVNGHSWNLLGRSIMICSRMVLLIDLHRHGFKLLEM